MGFYVSSSRLPIHCSKIKAAGLTDEAMKFFSLLRRLWVSFNFSVRNVAAFLRHGRLLQSGLCSIFIR